ncbi:LYR motif-containing protein 5 [Podila humilis]|nr:LYR motif-containing protein 5 [Podila humilis]
MLARMTNLQAVLVDKVMLYQRSHILQGLDQLPYRHLRYLRLPHVSSENGINLLLKVCEASYGIQHLELMDSEVDDETLLSIAQRCPRLKTLDLSRNEIISFTEFCNQIDNNGAPPHNMDWECSFPPPPQQQHQQHQDILLLVKSGLVEQGTLSPGHTLITTNTRGTRKMAHSPHKEDSDDEVVLHDPYCLICCGVLGWHEALGDSSSCSNKPEVFQNQRQNDKDHSIQQRQQQKQTRDHRESDRQQWSSIQAQSSCQQTLSQPVLAQHQTIQGLEVEQSTKAQTQMQTDDQYRHQTQHQQKGQQQAQLQLSHVVSSCDESRMADLSTTMRFALAPFSNLHPTSSLLKEEAPFTYLEELNLVFCFGIIDHNFQRLFRSFQGKSLRSLNLQFTNIEDSGLETLARTFALSQTATATTTTTTVDATKPFMDKVVVTGATAKMPVATVNGKGVGRGLTSLKLSYCNKITAKGILALVEHCSQLLELEFLSCDKVSAECFSGIPWTCTGLERLEFTFHPMVVFAEEQDEENSDEKEEEWQQEEQLAEDSGAIFFSFDEEVKEEPENPHHQQESELTNGQYQPKQLQQHRQQSPQLSDSAASVGYDNSVGHNCRLDREGECQEKGASVLRDYHAMFRQIKRLKRLKALHIYNSPLLNSKTHSSDQEEYGEGSSAPDWVNVTFADSLAAVSNNDTIVMDEMSSEGNAGSSSSSISASHLGDNQNHRQYHPLPSRQHSDMFEEEHSENFMMDASQDELNLPTARVSTALSSAEPTPVSHPLRSSTETAQRPEAIHPFHIRTGLKALKTLRQLHTLTLYERCNVKLQGPEVEWIETNLHQLRSLQLRGAIQVPEKSLSRLHERRPEIRVQLFYLGREYPAGADYFHKKLKAAFVKNRDIQDPVEIQKRIDLGDYICKEIEAMYHINKYRAMKKRYYDTQEESFQSSIESWEELQPNKG